MCFLKSISEKSLIYLFNTCFCLLFFFLFSLVHNIVQLSSRLLLEKRIIHGCLLWWAIRNLRSKLPINCNKTDRYLLRLQLFVACAPAFNLKSFSHLSTTKIYHGFIIHYDHRKWKYIGALTWILPQKHVARFWLNAISKSIRILFLLTRKIFSFCGSLKKIWGFSLNDSLWKTFSYMYFCVDWIDFQK